MEILLTQGTNELRFLNLLADFNIRSVECIRKERTSLEILSSLGSNTDLSLWVFPFSCLTDLFTGLLRSLPSLLGI